MSRTSSASHCERDTHELPGGVVYSLWARLCMHGDASRVVVGGRPSDRRAWGGAICILLSASRVRACSRAASPTTASRGGDLWEERSRDDLASCTITPCASARGNITKQTTLARTPETLMALSVWRRDGRHIVSLICFEPGVHRAFRLHRDGSGVHDVLVDRGRMCFYIHTKWWLVPLLGMVGSLYSQPSAHLHSTEYHHHLEEQTPFYFKT